MKILFQFMVKFLSLQISLTLYGLLYDTDNQSNVSLWDLTLGRTTAVIFGKM